MSIKSFPVIDPVATGRNIVRLRKESGLSVADLQKYFGFEAPQAIYKWQKGQSLPSTDNLLALGHLLDVTMEEILVTRPTIMDNAPQEESCGSHRFGDVGGRSFFQTDKRSLPSLTLIHLTGPFFAKMQKRAC